MKLTPRGDFLLCVVIMLVLGISVFIAGYAAEANATAPCATKAEFAAVKIGDHKGETYRTLDSRGERTLMFKWDMAGYPPAWSEFRDFKRCDGKTVQIEFFSWDKKHWKVQDKVTRG